MKNKIKYKQITKKSEFKLLEKNQTLNRMITKEIAQTIRENPTQYKTYIIHEESEITGFFTINTAFIKKEIIKLECIYIYEKYRQQKIATNTIENITWSLKQQHTLNYIIANTFINSCLFFIKNNFNFYKFENKNTKTKNMVSFCKKI